MALNIDLVVTSYAKSIIAGNRTIADVPTNLQEAVTNKISELQP